MKLFRVENRDTEAGLWYSGLDATPSNVVHELGLSGRNLPMGFDLSIATENWRSAADSINTLKFWFSFEDLLKLKERGYGLYEVESEVWKIHTTPDYQHHLFLPQRAQYTELDINILLK